MTDNIKVYIDKNWDLEDLYKFPRTFEQTYFAYLALVNFDSSINVDRIDYALQAYPWKGGYSAVNFYNQLKYSIPRKDRPAIKSISYASPGWIELSLIQEVAVHIGIVVASICGSLRLTNSTYSAIYRGMQERKLSKLEIKEKEFSLAERHYHFLREARNDMGNILGIENIDSITEKSGNELRTLKILLSVYRRMRTLAEYERKGKAIIPKDK